MFSSCFLGLDLWVYSFNLILKNVRHYFSKYFCILSILTFGNSKNMYTRAMWSWHWCSIHLLNFSILFMLHFSLYSYDFKFTNLFFYNTTLLLMQPSILFISQLAIISRILILLLNFLNIGNTIVIALQMSLFDNSILYQFWVSFNWLIFPCILLIPCISANF